LTTIRSKPPTKEYEDGWDMVFRKDKQIKEGFVHFIGPEGVSISIPKEEYERIHWET
jgi:hypothetical protein